MKRIILAVSLIGLSMSSIACGGGGDATGPDNTVIPPGAMNGLYTGSTSNAEIRVQVAYGVLPGATHICDILASLVDRILCAVAVDNLHGTGSITLRETGEVQTFQFSGLQLFKVVLFFSQPNGVMLNTQFTAAPSEDGQTLSGMIGPKTGAAKSAIFGDSSAITFVRSPGP